MKHLFAFLFFVATPLWAMPPSDSAPDWYYPQWLAEAPHTPAFRVRDTVNKYGRYAQDTKTVTIKDLIKFHGHFRSGLVEGATALKVAFDRLFPDGVIDRTNRELRARLVFTHGDRYTDFGEKPNRRRAEVYARWYF